MADRAARRSGRLGPAPSLSAASRAAIVDLQSALETNELWQAVRIVLEQELPQRSLPLPSDLAEDLPTGEPLSAHERSVLEYLRPMIAAAQQRLQSTEAEQQRLRAYEDLLSRMPTATLLLDAAGGELFATPEGRKQCARWNRGLPRGTADAPMPLQLLRMIEGAAPDSAAIRIGHPRIEGLTASIERQWHTPSLQPQAAYLIEFSEGANEAEAADLSPTAWLALQKLSRSERKVALLAARGLSNEEIARQRCRSPRTIEYQLHLIFRKLEISRRAQLVRLLS
ncbi:MAG TPA: helix-turn-helix transcriptional regulator [Fontimonas sp.]